MEERISVKFGGQSGQGINLLGQLISRALKESNYHVFGYREYPSIIKGGFASYQIDFGSSEILSPEKKCDILACIAQEALEEYLFTVSSNGVIFHSVKDFEFSEKAKEYINKNSIKVIYIDLKKMAQQQKAPAIMENMIMLGSIWKVLGQDIKTLTDSVVKYFSKKEGIDIEAEKRCLNAGYSLEEIKDDEIKDVPKSIDKNWEKSLILTG
ncbi:MAG TPA: 2-oxoacid:acceptor oxidoreductase family protein, partial [Candidatus Dojkabacteria bacterium]|nr:2-oxoacid:acceptor oxidoreductase family protein [Candidatus Dojkabacteria bacterium]